MPEARSDNVTPPRRRRIIRIFAILGITLLVLLGASLLFLHTAPARRFAVAQVTEALRQQNIDFTADELGYNLLEASLSLRNLRVQSPDAPDLPAFATIDRVSLDLSLMSLLRGRYVLESGEAHGVNINYVVDQAGNDNLPRPPTDPDQPSEPLDYLIEDFQIASAHVHYENRAQGIDLAVPVSSIDIEGNALTDRHTLTLESGGGTIVVEDRTITLDSLTGEVNAGEDDVRVEQLDIAAEGARAEVTGTLTNFADPRVDLEVQGTVDAARAATLTGLEDPVGGIVNMNLDVTGPLRTPAIGGHVAGRNVRFRDLTNINLDTDLSYDMRDSRIAFSDLALRSPFGQVSGSGAIAIGGDGTSRVTAAVSNINVTPLMHAFDVPVALASRIDARVNAEWPGLQYLEASGDATATLTATRSTGSAIPLGGRVEIRARGDIIDATLSGVNTGSAEVNGRVQLVNQEQLDGRVTLNVANIERAVATAEAALGRPSGSLLPTDVGGRLGGTLSIAGTVSAPRVAAALEAPALTIGKASDLSLATNLTYTPALVTVRNLDVRWQQATLQAAGTIALQGSQRMNFGVTANQLQVSELLRALEQPDVPASGTLTLQGQLTGTANRPAASFTVAGNDLVAYDERWGTLAANVNLTGRELVVAKLAIDKPQPTGDGRIAGRGTYHLDRRTYSFDLQSQDLQLVDLTLPGGRTLRGQLELTAGGDGSVQQPAATVNLTAEGLQLDQYDLGRVAMDAVVANQQATIDFAAPAYGVSADATIGVQAPYPTTADLRVDNLQLASLPLELQTPLEGQLAATIRAEGPLQDPRDGTATATIQAFSGSWNEQPFRVDAPAVIRYATERLGIEQLRLVAQDSTVALSGELPLTDEGAPGAITIDARANLATLAGYAPAGMDLTAAGELALTGVVRGTLEAIDPALSLTIANGAVTTPQMAPGLSNLAVRARVEDGAAVIEQLDGNFGTAAITAKGEVPLDVLPELPVAIPRRGGPATLIASVQGLEISQLPGAPAGVDGRISLDAQMSADRANLSALEGQVSFGELQLVFNGLTLAQQQQSIVAINGGAARVEQFTLTGSVGTVSAAGTVGLAGERPLNLDVEGNLNVAAISAFTDVVRAEGDTTLNIAARGTIASPELNGFVDLSNANFVVDEPTIAAENVDARLDLSGRRLTVTGLNGAINGGTLTGSGFVVFGEGGVADASLEITTDDVANDFPLDLRSLSDATLRLTRQDNTFVLSGQVTIDEAGQTGDINFDEGLLAAIGSRHRLDLTEQRNPFLERLRFNVNIDTATPILVENNLARAEVAADLRVLGTPYEPGLAGRLEVLEGGEITLNERRYEVVRGAITFIGEREIIPSFDLQLHTAARNYDITLSVTGTPGETETSLTSNPTLPEPDIMSLLVTGRTLEEMRGEEFEVAREQVLSYLAGRVGSQLGRGLQEATGLSTVRIEPNLIASEADPSARLTVGQDITRDLELIYSVDLTNSNDQIWVAEYDITRRFQTSTIRQSDNSYRFDFRHDVRFGGSPAPERIPRQRPTIADVVIHNDGTLPDAEVRLLFDVEAGDQLDFFEVRDAVDDVRDALLDRGRLQARVRLQREGDDSVALTLNVDAGPRVDLTFTGATPPPDIVEDVRVQWQRGVFDTQRIDDSVEVLRGWLMENDFLQAKVTGDIDDAGPDARRVRFTIDPGTKSETVLLAFEGASGVDPDVLDEIVDQQDLELQLFTDPVQVTELLERYYGEQGYLVASIDEPKYEFDGTQARVVLDVTEGPRFIIDEVTVTGNTVIPTPQLLEVAPVKPGEPFLPFAAENALRQLRDLYWTRGYNEMRPDYQLEVDRDAGRANVRFTIEEGAQSVVAGIEVEGNRKTSDRLVREQVELTPGQPLDLKALARSRSNLYETRAFSLVDVTREEMPAENGQKPVRLQVSVREVQPIQLRYGASFDTERGLGGIADLSNHNTFGKARVVGIRGRYDAQLREGRVYFNQPPLQYWPIETTASVYYVEEHNPETQRTGRFDIDRRGVSIQQERDIGRSYLWTYGVRYERARSLDPLPGGTLDERVTVVPLNSTFTRETRDDVLDATRGSLLSHAFEYSPPWLGADQSYLKYFGQYFHYFPLRPPQRERLTGELLRPRLVFASGVRLGIARGLGSVVPLSERFFAGGSTTLRAFEQNALGPIGADDLPRGGNALLVINNELRFPLISIFDGVVFSDIGNVFPLLSDFSLSELRETAGLGVRVRTPWFLVRGDYGFLLDRRAGERRGRFYFSIGQAF